MSIPLLPVYIALKAGGTLVPHAAGGMIVRSAVGYVAGTYLSTTAIGGILGSIGAGVLASVVATKSMITGMLHRTAITGVAASTVAGRAAVGATGVISASTITSISAGVLAVSFGYSIYRFTKLKQKINQTKQGNEIFFDEKEAKIVERAINLIANKDKFNI